MKLVFQRFEYTIKHYYFAVCCLHTGLPHLLFGIFIFLFFYVQVQSENHMGKGKKILFKVLRFYDNELRGNRGPLPTN